MEEDIFLRSLENAMLNLVRLCGVKGVKRVVLKEQDRITISLREALSVAKRRSGFWKPMALTSRFCVFGWS